MRLCELLKFDDIVIQCHDYPDADTVASGLALYRYLEKNGKSPRLIYSGAEEISKPNMKLMLSLLHIPLEYIPLEYIQRLSAPELLVTVDCTYGEKNVTKFEAQNVATIDHHASPKPDFELFEIRSNYGSCSSVMAAMLFDEGFDINSDKEVATALYYGLYMDTNALAEISHPADKDLRDIARYDTPAVTLMKNSILSPEEMDIAGDALNNCRYDYAYGFACVEARPCDPNILGFISDLLMQVDTVDVCVVFCKKRGGYKLSARSCKKEINASDFAKFVTENIGNGGGHYIKAGGYINEELFFEKYGGMSLDEYFEKRIKKYLTSFDVINSEEYIADISAMTLYAKRKLTIGYVPTTDVVKAGTQICIRMLEGDYTITADDNTFIMVGIQGEVYPISREKFEKSYQKTNEMPSIDTEYEPKIVNSESFTVTRLTPFVRGCISNEESKIYAKPLATPTKLFTAWDTEHYMYGAVGDYFAVREDNKKDMYIINKNLFDKLYSKV